jgi:hypothetical protein
MHPLRSAPAPLVRVVSLPGRFSAFLGVFSSNWYANVMRTYFTV